jgi:hypothetical protein
MHTIVSICTVVLVKQLNCFFFFAHQRAAAAPLTMYLTYGSEQVLSFSFLGLYWYKSASKLVQKPYKSPRKVLQKSLDGVCE